MPALADAAGIEVLSKRCSGRCSAAEPRSLRLRPTRRMGGRAAEGTGLEPRAPPATVLRARRDEPGFHPVLTRAAHLRRLMLRKQWIGMAEGPEPVARLVAPCTWH